MSSPNFIVQTKQLPSSDKKWLDEVEGMTIANAIALAQHYGTIYRTVRVVSRAKNWREISPKWHVHVTIRDGKILPPNQEQ
jgi:hypothetical protein